MNVRALGEGKVLGNALADVAATRERVRRVRLRRIAISLAILNAWMWFRVVQGRPVKFGLPSFMSDPTMMPILIIVGLLGVVILLPFIAAGRSPHILYRPSEIETGFDDVKGLRPVKDEVLKTLNLFLAHKTFKEVMGGTARRGILFEGPPGTGKTYMAKAMAREAGVPFLFASSSAFQSMYYGQTNRKIRNYFKAMRKAARQEGGAIGFIEEIDAIGSSRQGMSSGVSEGISGVVNELLIQFQSFDDPPRSAIIKGKFIDFLNRFLSSEGQIRKRPSPAANILVIGATNRASDLDPALLRPGRFDRSIHFDLPSRPERREIIDYYLGKKAHVADLDDEGRRNALAAMTFGYSPVMIEHLFDEALVWALRRGEDKLDWSDIQQAKMTEELGLTSAVEYTEDERRRIATHEAGHATVAHLVGKDRKLEVLSIIKRRDALGLLAHSDREERFTKTKAELEGLVQIAFGGMVAEELYFGEAGTGPAGDLLHATNVVAQMVGSLGMAGTLISYEAMGMAGAHNVVAKVASIDEGRQAMERVLSESKASVTQMLNANRHLVEALRDALLDRDELLGEEILSVIREAEDSAGVVDLTVLDSPQEKGEEEGLVPPGFIAS